ncbi:hypothetical protein HMPREF0742_00239 [Rothia aeria F0184]|uniref:Uncharacterized protein n=1 Tax=Rothia aeria F0184 TaxID=888019 RepID=U7V864_9MICC|nr:hypothetical protein HMPREF0742_00239 [Rothia aeria F0184]
MGRTQTRSYRAQAVAQDTSGSCSVSIVCAVFVCAQALKNRWCIHNAVGYALVNQEP